jgi:hypothetical protein
MVHNELDRILSEQEEITPSSGFAASVMDAVRREAAAPPPIPFPWKRALPGLLAVCLALMSLLVSGSRLLISGTATESMPSAALTAFSGILQIWRTVGANWIALALILSFASMKFSTRFASGKT